jgi:heme A synthase
VGDVLSLAFGTTVAMWTVGYLTHQPGGRAPGWIVLVLLLACLLGGGALTGRLTRRGVWGGAAVGCLSGLLNLLILGSLLIQPEKGSVVPAAAIWVPGSIALCGAAGALGASSALLSLKRDGLVSRVAPGGNINWPAVFSLVTATATLLLLSVGGVVTGYQAGLAVPDWPNSYGYNMFLYPLARMTGGIYYEHAHRLFGALVGLTTLVFAAYLQFREPRRWVRVLGGVALLAVIVQGLLGGLRVTGRLTMSAAAEDLSPNLALAIAHGVFGQMYLALLGGLTIVLTRSWQTAWKAREAGAGTDVQLALLAVACLLIQLVLGALFRHTNATWALLAHITMAVVVVGAVATTAFRAWAMRPGMARLIALCTALLVQFIAENKPQPGELESAIASQGVQRPA